jgi:hypothetical protein
MPNNTYKNIHSRNKQHRNVSPPRNAAEAPRDGWYLGQHRSVSPVDPNWQSRLASKLVRETKYPQLSATLMRKGEMYDSAQWECYP